MNDNRRRTGKKVTIRDVAKEAGVSAQTVSRVINNKGEIRTETRQQVLTVIDRLGYRPSSIARGLATRRTFTLGLVVPDIANPFFAEVAGGIEEYAWQNEYGVILCNTGEDQAREAAAIRSLEDKQVDGLVLCSPRLPDDELFDAIRGEHVVFVNRDGPADRVGVVATDDARGAELAGQHLLSLGRKRIAMLTGPATSRSGQRRQAAFGDAMARHGQDVQVSFEPCEPTAAGGERGLAGLLDRAGAPDGLVAYNDLVAIGALQTAAARGLAVPEQLAIIGHDDAPASSLVRPSLTTLHVDKRSLGQQAGRMLIDWITGRGGPGRITLQPELVIRQTAPQQTNAADDA